MPPHLEPRWLLIWSPSIPKARDVGDRRSVVSAMLRMYVAQQCFGLSDEGIEDAICDGQPLRRFVGIDLEWKDAPDATAQLKLHWQLETHEFTRKILGAINLQLGEKDLLIHEGSCMNTHIGVGADMCFAYIVLSRQSKSRAESFFIFEIIKNGVFAW